MDYILLVILLNASFSSTIATYLPVSCYDHLEAAKHENRNISDGVYNISYNGSPLSVYCDMTQDGGGWMLMVGTNTGLNWNTGNIYSRNTANPGLDIDYSILSIADTMNDKSLLLSFEYRIEAGARGRWGGIWRAPVTYSVASEDETQTNIEEMTKFDSYTYNDGASLGFRVPWIYTGTYSLLTTGPRQISPWWGTLIIPSSGVPPTGWGVNAYISDSCKSGGHMHNVKPIYYWMRNFNMKIILESLGPINANSCKDQHFMIDENNTTCVSRDTINCAGCVFTYKFNASVYCDTTHVMIYGQFIQGLTFLVYTTGDEEMESQACEEITPGTTNEATRIFRCTHIRMGELNVAAIIGKDQQNFFLCEIHLLNYIVA